MPERSGDRALAGAGLLVATGTALLVGTHLFGALPVAAVAFAAVLARWASARPSAEQEPLDG